MLSGTECVVPRDIAYLTAEGKVGVAMLVEDLGMTSRNFVIYCLY
jgi:hypothetical protein